MYNSGLDLEQTERAVRHASEDKSATIKKLKQGIFFIFCSKFPSQKLDFVQF